MVRRGLINDHFPEPLHFLKEESKNHLQIPISWRDRFSIEAEKLELDDPANIPLRLVDFEKMAGAMIISYKIQTQAWVEILKDLFRFLVSGTGSGKTLAIILGIIEILPDNIISL